MSEIFARFILDTYPSLNGKQIDGYSCAVVKAYIAPEKNLGTEGNLWEISDQLFDEGWVVASIIDSTEIMENDIGELASEVVANGYAFDVNRVVVERVYRAEKLHEISSLTEITNFINAISTANEMYSLFSRKDNQFANGLTPNGEEFLPLWASKNLVKNWTTDFLDYELETISLARFREAVAEQMNVSSMMIGVGSVEDQMLMVHPKLILDSLEIKHK